MPRPAGYSKDDWTVCQECGGDGVAETIGGYERPCDGCSGEGGWPANATRFDDLPEEEEDHGGCDCAALLAGNSPPHHPTCPLA